MKIAFVVDDTLDKPDGVQQYVLALGAWMRNRGHEVHYLVGDSQRSDVPNVHSLSRTVNVRFNGNRLGTPLPSRRSEVKALLERERFDVLHVQMPYSPLMAGRIIRAASKSTVVVGTFHILPYGTVARLGTSLLGTWSRSTLRRFDRIMAVSTEAGEFAAKAFRLSDVAVSPNVVDVARFGEAAPFDAYNDDVPTIVFLGRLVPRKGCHVLLQAAANLCQQPGRRFRVLVCGKGPMLNGLRDFVRQHELEEVVSFTGFVEEADKPRFVASADIMVFPSSGGESFGIVLIEAMASGRPLVLAGDNPGYRTVVGERPELLFSARDADCLTKRLAHFLDDGNARRAAIGWQRQYVKQFDIAKVGAELLELYGQLLLKKPKA